MKIILASGSPRRKELMEQAGYQFEIEVSDADENLTETRPDALVEELSFRKAFAVAAYKMNKNKDIYSDSGKDPYGGCLDRKKENCVIIGADTVVALGRKILGKPNGEKEAEEMLSLLSGKTHQVYTGVSLLLLKEGEMKAYKKFHVCTDVTMRELTRQEISDYITTGEPLDKAGAYGIQGKAAVFISGICGDYYNVVGLPVCELTQQMKRLLEENV